ncbi:LexA family protein [Nesterenkonia aerolata]|uniref:Translesion error-prone DNA polymerase V autoproteolytic subunit n=1 Tax=Nesterenkonia aerolata TaxID=3074079 RepID=A0ABU2DVG3_9MICC|nr:translesion error-prone DNA polymerase V autoproteolytic subunit [Nesterenkonia sp. LY-0111]MDR8020493.1 translesion error-prone DNA polymerase V autoproteolytic subunit [Nesterenkonia sp. LY-0111]
MRVDSLQILEPSAAASTVLLAPVAVPCGYPSPAQDYYDGPLDLTSHLIKDSASTFLVRVTGDSMEQAGISDGDELIVDRARTPKDMSVVVAILDGELTVKRLRITSGGVVLQAESQTHPDLVVGELSELEIWGVVIKCIHNV